MPDPGTYVMACTEIPQLGDYDRRTQSQPIIGKQKVEGHAHVVRENPDGTIDVTIYGNKPSKDNDSRAICGASNLKQGDKATRAIGTWWVE